MPELPEVETTLQGISPHIKHHKVIKVLIRRSDLRWPVTKDIPHLLANSILLDVTRRGKYLLLQFEQGVALIHLGMSGSISIVENEEVIGKHDHFDIQFSNHKILRFNDPRRFGAFLWAGKDPLNHKLLINLGVEPFDKDFNGNYCYRAARSRKIAVKSFIMDAKLVVGVGNIYANEALFLAGIHPARSANRIGLQRYQNLVLVIKKVLTNAIKQGGTTLRDFTQVDGKPGYFSQSLNVYGRAGLDCLQCAEPLTEIRQSGRSSVFCNNCQS